MKGFLSRFGFRSEEQASISTPASGERSLTPKSDGWYDKDAAGVETLLGAATAGADGKTVLNGSGAPSGGVGVDGDFYIDTTASAIYGPKTAGAWGSPTSLIGPTGSAGLDGRTVLNGSGVPSGGTGANGDFYIDTTAHTIYGPKTAGAWGSSTNLVGPTGATGAPGSGGLSGFVGFCGSGADGNVTISGSTLLTRDMFYDTLTIGGSGILSAQGFRIYCKTALVVNTGGVIHNDGNNASGAGASGGVTNSLLGGTNGGNGGSTTGNAGTNGTARLGGRGGAGGNGSSGAGAAAGTIAAPNANTGEIRSLPQSAIGATLGNSGASVGGGTGGGGGGGDGANGGGGGGGGGVVLINAPTVTNNGTIRAHGGNGETRVTGTNVGGGGPGGGGLVIINCTSFSGNTPTASPGTPGNGRGTGTNGAAGNAGRVDVNIWT